MGDMARILERAVGMPVRRITVDEYHRMGEAGILSEDERVELLDGLLIEMAPIGYRHEYAGGTLAHLLGLGLGRRAVIRANSPLTLGASSEPQPDVMLLRAPFTRYRNRLPAPSDVVLLVEVAESSRKYDRGRKAHAYALAGIPELWIIDLVDEEVVVLREPGADGFRLQALFRRGDLVSPSAFPDVPIAVADLLESAAPTR